MTMTPPPTTLPPSSLIGCGSFRNVDWHLRTCARRGHLTYAPDEPSLRERLHSTTAIGEAWRCLRCGAFVLGAAHRSGPAAGAPSVRRGRARRDAVRARLCGPAQT